MEDFIDKYTPKKINKIIGSKEQICDIVSWLRSFKKNKIHRKKQNVYSNMLILGDNGTGKTTILNAILNDMKYNIKTINFRKININLPSLINQIIENGYIYDKIERNNRDLSVNGIERNRIVIVVDKLEYLSSSLEKKIIETILKENNEHWICPIIFIGNNKHTKLSKFVKKETLHININVPTENNMMQLLERICLSENIVFEHDMKIITTIIENSQQDYRRMIIIMAELYRLFNTSVITYDMIVRFFTYVGNKDMEMSIFQNTTKLFTEFNGISESLKIFESDKSIIPLMIHQNYFTVINNYTIGSDTSDNISESMSHGDIIDNYIYSEQNWNLQEIYGFYSCVYPSYVITNNINKKKLLQDSIYPKSMPKYISIYPKDYNKTSTKRINYKNIKYANNFFPYTNIYDYIYICKYIIYMLSTNRTNECKYILKDYNINITGIMYILKIDKINGTKNIITKELEKQLKIISNNPIKKSIIKKI